MLAILALMVGFGMGSLQVSILLPMAINGYWRLLLVCLLTLAGIGCGGFRLQKI